MSTTDGHDARSFPSTHWSVIALAGRGNDDGWQDHLAALLRRYYAAMRAHIVSRFRWRFRPDQIDDLLQGFVADKVLAMDLIGRADRSKGRFRTLLLTALDRYVLNHFPSAGQRMEGSGEPELTPDQAAPPTRAFDVAWARELIGQVLDRMKTECMASEPQRWTVFVCRVLAPAMEGAEPASYKELVEQCGFASPMQASNALITAKRMFARILREVVGEYAADEAGIDEEIIDLRKILAGVGA